MEFKLRISVTDRCNLKCIYCKPPIYQKKASKEILSFEEIYNICDFFSSNFSINTIKITGGEPLVRKDIHKLLGMLKGLKFKRLSITTNGILLEEKINLLKENGLDDLNLSLDTLKPKKFKKITGGELGKVLRSLEKTLKAKIPVKINCVLIRGINDDEILDLLKWSWDLGVFLRFIEYMPFKSNILWKKDLLVSKNDILKTASLIDKFKESEREGVTTKYFLKNGKGFGIIPSVSEPFCKECNRIRITADGYFIPCFKQKWKIHHKEIIKNPEKIYNIFSLKFKNEEMFFEPENEMVSIGG